MRLGSMLSNRFLLLLGSRGAVVGRMRGGRLGPLQAVPIDALQSLSDRLAADPQVPLTVLLDLPDLNFRRESLPVVGLLDRDRVLRRRLEIAFPGADMRGALPLPTAAAVPGSSRKERHYLFAAVVNTADWARWRDWLDTLANPLSAVGLMPVELAGIASALAPTPDAPPSDGELDHWTLLICRHWSGGVRQLVLQNGSLVLTRLTPATSSVEGSGLALEVRATLGYLARLGFSGRVGIHVSILGPADWAEELAASALPLAVVRPFTMEEAASRLRLSLPTLAEDPAGSTAILADSTAFDGLSLAWMARQNRIALDVLPRDWRIRGRAGSLTRFANAGLAGAALLAAGVLVSGGLDLVRMQQEEEVLSGEIQVLSGQREEILAKLAGTQVDARFADAAVRHADAWMTPGPERLLDALRLTLPADLQLDRLSWTGFRQPPPAAGAAPIQPQPVAAPRLELVLRLSGSLSAREAVDRVGMLVATLREAMPAVAVTVEQGPIPMSLAEPYAGSSGHNAPRTESYTATLVLEGTP